MTDSAYELVPALKRASVSDYVKLFAEVYGATDKLTLEYLRWLYVANPCGQVVGMDAYSNGSLAAHYATVPRAYKLADGSVVKSLLSVNTATHPEHRRQGLFKITANGTYELAKCQGFEVVVGVANSQSIHAFRTSLGFTEVGQVGLLVNGRKALSSKGLISLNKNQEWLEWRLEQPNADYWGVRGVNKVFVFTNLRGIPFLLAAFEASFRVPRALVIASRMPRFYLTPVYPVPGCAISVPRAFQPSPWFLIVKPLTDLSVCWSGEQGLEIDGLAMDTF